MLGCWGLGEVIRYPWYALTLTGSCPQWLTWLRCAAAGGEGRRSGPQREAGGRGIGPRQRPPPPPLAAPRPPCRDPTPPHHPTPHPPKSRYSAFILIYPVGVVAEMVLMYRALPFIRARKLFSVFMPNAYNFAFDYAIFITVGVWWGVAGGRLGGVSARCDPLAPLVPSTTHRPPTDSPPTRHRRPLTPHPPSFHPPQVFLFLYPYLWWGLYSTLLRQRRKRLGPQPASGDKRD
jgi:hypothetical protein